MMIDTMIIHTNIIFRRLTRLQAMFGHRKIGTTSINRQAHNEPGNQNPQLRVFEDNATKWWSGKEFAILRSMNEIRVPFIVNGLGKPMDEARLIDVGCGGGILSEALARSGANVLGIDPVFESINQAQLHAQLDKDLESRLKYRNCNIEDLSSQAEHIESYDALVASEVLEHIEDVESFLKHSTKLIKPNGSLFITTINQTPLSWLGVIFFGEYVLQQLPKGTHTYDMFVNIKGLRVMLERMGYHIRSVSGFMYEPISGSFFWTPTTLTHYALHAVKEVPLANGINHTQKRYLAKSNKKIAKPRTPLSDNDMKGVISVDNYRAEYANIKASLKEHFEIKLTLRASVGSLETLKVHLSGLNEPLELRDIAQLSLKGNNLLVINLSTMPEAIKPTMVALENLGSVSPQVEVNNIFVPIPRVTREHRENLVKAAQEAANQAKLKVRSLFSNYSAQAKNSTGVSKDLVKDVVDNLQYDMHVRIAEIESMLQTKTAQLLNQ